MFKKKGSRLLGSVIIEINRCGGLNRFGPQGSDTIRCVLIGGSVCHCGGGL